MLIASGILSLLSLTWRVYCMRREEKMKEAVVFFPGGSGISK